MSIQISSDVVKSAISSKLSTRFPDIDIYKEQVIEGITYPSFFINQIRITPIHLFKNRYMYEFLMNVEYMVNPNDIEKYKDLENVGCELLETLSFIEVGGLKIKGKALETFKEKNIQITTIIYNIPIREIEEQGIKMQTLDIN